MKAKINTYLAALEQRFINSRFQQAINDWQDAHPAAAAVLDTTLHVGMWALCILLCIMTALFTIALAAWVQHEGSVRPVDVFILTAALLAACMSINTLRNW